jgi:hypothetical protein
MEEKVMTVERWNDPTVRAKFYSGFVDIFSLVGTTQRDDIVDTRKPRQEDQPSR